MIRVTTPDYSESENSLDKGNNKYRDLTEGKLGIDAD